MYNKALATIILTILLIGTFGFAINIVPKTNAQVDYTLTINYAPNPMGSPPVVPDINPSPGAYQYTQNSIINVTAPQYVSAGTGIRYVFNNWTFYYGPYQNITDGVANTLEFDIKMNQDWTMVAMYHLEYLFTVVTPFDTPWIYGPVTLWQQLTSEWFDSGTVGVQAAVGQGVITNDGISQDVFINWSGDVSGNGWPAPPGTYSPNPVSRYSSFVNMTGPMTAIANWQVQYYLYTGTMEDQWDGGSTGPYGPGSGWYPTGTVVQLNATLTNRANDLQWRWLFDQWDIQNWNATSSTWYIVDTETTQNVTVTVNQAMYCIAQYRLQYYLVVTTIPSFILSGAESETGWYYYGDNVTLAANQIVADPTDPVGARWNFSYWWIPLVLYRETRITTVQILGPYTAYAGYTKQYYIRITTSPASILTMPNVNFTGIGWYDAGALRSVNALNTTIMNGLDTKWVFVRWDFEGDGTTPNNPAGPWSIGQAWNATAVYTRQYRATAMCDPVNTGGPWAVNLNTWNSWPVAGFELWADENSLVGWSALSGPVYGYPFYYYFDRWTITNTTTTYDLPKGQNAILGGLNFTGPMTTVAHYAGESAFFTSPMTIIKTVPAYCTPFEVNVTAANLVDMYACDFNVTWDPLLFELVGSNVRVREIWNQSIYWENSLPGNYHLVATQTAPGLGFSGTHTIVTLTFHIIYDPCYVTPYYKSCPISLVGPAFSNTYPMLTNSLGNAMYPWMVSGSTYRIDAIKPTLYMRPSAVTVSQKGATFTVEIWIRNATKLKDYEVSVWYDRNLLEVTNVVLNTTFLTGPYSPCTVDYTTNPGYVYILAAQKQPGNVLANGTGQLATIYFGVINPIFWTTANIKLSCDIQFNYARISVMCPTWNYINTPDLGTEKCVYTYAPIPGDVNMDGVVNILDLMLVAAEYGSYTLYDLNGDGKVNLLDIVLVAINFGRTTPA